MFALDEEQDRINAIRDAANSPKKSRPQAQEVARTIADLEGHEAIDRNDLGEAISYRRKRQAAAFSTT